MEQVLAFLANLIANPLAQAIALMIAGWAVTISWQVAAKWLRWKGQHDVDAAKTTADTKDDAQALQEQAILNALADALEAHNPGSAISKLVKTPGTLPPVVLTLLKNLPSAIQAAQDLQAKSEPIVPPAPPAPPTPTK